MTTLILRVQSSLSLGMNIFMAVHIPETSHNGFDVIMYTEAEVDLVKKALDPYADYFAEAEYEYVLNNYYLPL